MGTVPTQPTVNHHKCVALWLRNGKTIKRSGRGVRNEALRQCVALLATTSPMTLAAIARTLGVTKQRVYQIASALPDWCGRERRRAACQEVLKAKALATSRLQAIMESCPFEVKLIPYTQAASGFHLQKVMIEGKSCRIITVGRYKKGFREGYYELRAGHPSSGIDFSLALVPHSRIMVIPTRLYKRTAFVLGDRGNYGAKRDYHGWNDLVGAWHLLKGGEANGHSEASDHCSS